LDLPILSGFGLHTALSKDTRTQDLILSKTHSITRILSLTISKLQLLYNFHLPLPLLSAYLLLLLMLPLALATIWILHKVHHSMSSLAKLSTVLFYPMSGWTRLKFSSRLIAINCGHRNCKRSLRGCVSTKFMYQASTHHQLRLQGY
jgi:hypothetical protein